MQVVALLLAVIFVIVLDQAAKSLVLLRLCDGRPVTFASFAIRPVVSRRMGWVLWNGDAAPVGLLLVEFILFVAIAQSGAVFTDTIAPAALGAALGGASSNVLDRLRRGGVVDFIDLKFWPVFNLADVAIVLGVLIGALNL